LILQIRRWVAARLPNLGAESSLPELVATGCLLILPWIGIAFDLHREYYGARMAAMQSTGVLARALEESTRRTVGQIDYILLSARAMLVAKGDDFDFHEWVRTQTVADKMTAQIAIADRTGRVIASTMPLPPGLSIADREHFRVQVDPARDDLFISDPLIGRASGLQTIQFSRKLFDQEGAFAGIVVLSLGSEELARFYEALALGDGFVSILSARGSILGRGPWVPELAGASIKGKAAFADVLDLAAGSLDVHERDGDVAQIVSFRRLRDYPLVVMVGFDAATVFSPYRSLRNRAVLGAATITMAVALIGFLWVRQKQRSLASRRALTVTLETISQGILMVDAEGDVSVINRRVLDLLAWPDEKPDEAMKLVASRAVELIPASSASDDRLAGGAAVPDGRFETTLDDGTIIEVRSHALGDGGFVQSYTDVTEQRLAHAQVQHLAHHDEIKRKEKEKMKRRMKKKKKRKEGKKKKEN
jgi:PAS domain-containing protein